MLASDHPPTDGAQRGPDTHSVILLENMESPGNAARLFAETPFQCCACTCKRNSTADASARILRSFLAADATTNVGALYHRIRIFEDAPGASLGHRVSPRGDGVMITE